MKSRILLFIVFFFGTGILFAQNAQEIFDQDLEKIQVSLKKYEPDSLYEKEPATSAFAKKEPIQKPISCQEIESTIVAVNNLLKQKVGIRADNKLKIDNILSRIPEQSKINCKDLKADCCKEQLKQFEDFCRLNGFLKEVFPDKKNKE